MDDINYIVAIPSYDRLDAIKNKTLKMLKEQNVKPECIDIFVANEEEEKKYRDNIDKSLYNKIIIGKLGLLNQRNFIVDYYQENQYIINIDDDIDKVMKKKTNIKTDKELEKVDLDLFFKEAYKILNEKKLYIYGVLPVSNYFFMYDKITTDLRYICGGLYGFINRKDDDIKLKLQSGKEDFERTLLYYIKDGGVVRFNNIYIKTLLYGSGGMQTEYGSKSNRLLVGKKNVEVLKEKYSNYGDIKVRPSGIYEFVLRRNPNKIKKEKVEEIEEIEEIEEDKEIDYIVAIPSYNRLDIIKERTLKTLKEQNIKSNKIDIFVANEEEEKKYRDNIDKSLYNKIIVGKLGLLNQRNFIVDYYKEKQYIIEIDDDIEGVFRKANNIKNDRKLDKLDLDLFFKEAYKNLINNNLYIWGSINISNTFFMNEKITTDLRYLMGGFFGFINRKDNDLKLTLQSEHEDFERTILFYKKDKGVVRYNNITLKTKQYSNGGMQTEYGNKELRINNGKIATEKLKETYPEFGEIKQYRDTGIYAFKLNKEPKYKEVEKPKEEPKPKIKKEIIKDEPIEEVKHYKIKKTKKYLKLKKELFELLEKTKIPKIDGKRSDGRKTRGDLVGYDAYTTHYGMGYRRNKGLSEFTGNTRDKDLYNKLVEYGNYILPIGFVYSAITINKDMKAKKHIDGGNMGLSFINTVGDFSGGELMVYPTENEKPNIYDLNDYLLSFNGSKLYHETASFTGRRYTIIYYNQKQINKIEGVKMEGENKY